MLRIGFKMRKVETTVFCLAVKRAAVIAIALSMAFSTSAQWKAAKEVSPFDELTIAKNGIIRQNGYLLSRNQIREVLSENRDILHQYNSGTTLQLIGTLVSIPGGCMAGFGIGWLAGVYIAGLVNDDNRASIHLGSGILIGIGAVGIGTGTVLMSSGKKKIKNAVLWHNYDLRSDATYRLDFGITQTGGVGLTLRF